MEERKIFVGNGKEHKYGIDISVCLSDLPKDHIFEYNGKKYIKLKVNSKKKPEYGKTHSVEVNTWKPEGNRVETIEKENDDLPF